MKVGTRSSIGAVLAAGCLMLGSGHAAAQEITLKAVNAFQEGTYPARGFEIFVKKVNAEGKGIVQIQYLGGPKAMPAAEHATALRRGVIDLANSTASYTANLVPEGMALSFSPLRMDVLRRNGAMRYLNDLYLEKGLYYLGRTYPEGIQYHIFTNKRIDRVDLTGQKLRIAAVYRDFFQTLGATVVQTAAGEVYTALERGIVDGFGWPLVGIFDLGWQEKVKYRIDPGFYSVEAGMVMSASAWEKLTPAQRAFLEKQVREFETENASRARSDAESELKRLQEAGIQTITLGSDDSKRFIEIANETAWEGLAKLSPKHGAKLRQLMSGM
ncbi:MAG: TRAP transporter substrate-binding protein DctP [Burkholderiaceae bacterium]|nr:TRAP transporter substrate-binding protein DctP [Burkholderiaceae bacterium]